MVKRLYLECYNGINGYMMTGALLDLGADKTVLEKTLSSLLGEEISIEIEKVNKMGLDMCSFNITGCEQKRFSDISDILEHIDMTKEAKKIAERIFNILKETQFSFTENLNSIIEIIGTAVCLDNLGITDVIIPVIYEGHGFEKYEDKIIPVPSPDVVHIATTNSINLHFTNIEGALITSTGIAIAGAIKTSDKLPESFTIEKIGVGTGKNQCEKAVFMRAMIINDTVSQKDYIYKLESNIDDCTGEMLGFVMERLLKAGAKDVHYTSVFMKKNRPAYQLNVLCKEEDIKKLEKIIFEETTTIGIRRMKMERTILTRSIEKVHTPFGEADVKVCSLENSKRVYPEYESIVSICREHGLPFQEVYQIIQSQYKNDK